MVRSGVCCASLDDYKALMKMGLGLVLVGHVNFLLGALVHGAVLRHINVHVQARHMEYAISNVIALVSGLLAIIAGISAIVLSKNRKNKPLTWFLFAISIVAALLSTASTVGLSVSIVMAIMKGGKGLLTHCKFTDPISYFSITNECPFDPTRVYGTTIILWVPLILMLVVETVFCGRCFAATISFLRLSCPWRRRKKVINTRRVRIRSPRDLESSSDQRQSVAEPAEQHELLRFNTPIPGTI
ncbi:transmembrane protein 54a [Clupea harengus]|uniref:Transmembrane protein 54a n=1 Tax=Clupea harengus TaxID=7950 RepID=A0A6P8GMH6_CLUHA|nr:transmembrane protein 54a [Clupea harengus]